MTQEISGKRLTLPQRWNFVSAVPAILEILTPGARNCRGDTTPDWRIDTGFGPTAGFS